MGSVGYYLALPFIYGISLLPFPLLYLLSDGIYFIIYRVLGYRKQVVFTNLRNSFPGKSEEEIKTIAKRFYRWFCDLTLETLKTLTAVSYTHLDVYKRQTASLLRTPDKTTRSLAGFGATKVTSSAGAKPMPIGSQQLPPAAG